RLDDLAVQTRVLEREMAAGADHAERLAEIARQRAATESRLAVLHARWEKERELVGKVRSLRERLEALVLGNSAAADAGQGEGGGEGMASGDGAAGAAEGDGAAAPASAEDAAWLRAELERLTQELRDLQGEEPLVPVFVDADLVSQVISGWTGIPVGKMLRDDLSAALELERHLERR